MESTPVISYENLPQTLPIYKTILVYMFLDQYVGSELIHGIVWTVVGILWISSLIRLWKQEQRDIFSVRDLVFKASTEAFAKAIDNAKQRRQR